MYATKYTPLALRQLRAVATDSDRNAIVSRIKEIQADPYRTRALRYGLEPYRRAKAAGRYRIIFAVDEGKATLRIAFIGIRMPDSAQDAYSAFERLLPENRL